MIENSFIDEILDDLNLDEFRDVFYKKSLIFTSGLYDNLKICQKTVQEFVEKTEEFMEFY